MRRKRKKKRDEEGEEDRENEKKKWELNVMMKCEIHYKNLFHLVFLTFSMSMSLLSIDLHEKVIKI